MEATTYPDSPGAISTAGLFGRVMALVALTVGFATLGVWLGRSLGGPGWFIAWLLSLSPVVIPIPGASRPESIADSARAAALELSHEELQAIGGIAQTA